MNCVHPFPAPISDYIENQIQWDYLCRVCVRAQSPQSYLTLCDPRTVAFQAPLSWDTSGKNTGVGCHPPEDLPALVTEPMSPAVPALQVGSSSLSHQESPFITCKLANAAVLVSCGHPDRALQSRCHRGCAPSECARGGSGPCFMQRLVSLSISCPVSISFQSASGVTLPSTNSYCLIHVRTHDYTQGPSG